MDWITLFASSASAAAISTVSSIYFRRLDYKFDFKKYVLKRRIQAYEKAEELITLANDKYYDTDLKGNQVYVSRFFYAEENSPITFEDYVIRTKKIFDYSLWFTDAFNHQLLKLNNIMGEIQTKYYDSKSNAEALRNLGIEYYEKMTKRYDLLIKHLFLDMKKLDDIKEFRFKKTPVHTY